MNSLKPPRTPTELFVKGVVADKYKRWRQQVQLSMEAFGVKDGTECPQKEFFFLHLLCLKSAHIIEPEAQKSLDISTNYKKDQK